MYMYINNFWPFNLHQYAAQQVTLSEQLHVATALY